jgi:putative transposase
VFWVCVATVVAWVDALGKDTPITRPVAPPSAGRIVATPEVGGLHHRYDRVAA